jgi:hypothetical protein
MPLQNRVMPCGAIIADPARGMFTGNRGILHRADRTLGRARWKTRAWICCTLDWKGVRRVPMSPGTWTELFFLDEAVALAAGHRPCGYCRRSDYRQFQAAWATAGLGDAAAPAMDRVLHASRLARDASGATHHADAETLPSGAMIVTPAGPALIAGDALWPFTPAGYGPPVPRLGGKVGVLTPAPVAALLRAGYAPALHPSASAVI